MDKSLTALGAAVGELLKERKETARRRRILGRRPDQRRARRRARRLRLLPRRLHRLHAARALRPAPHHEGGHGGHALGERAVRPAPRAARPRQPRRDLGPRRNRRRRADRQPLRRPGGTCLLRRLRPGRGGGHVSRPGAPTARPTCGPSRAGRSNCSKPASAVVKSRHLRRRIMRKLAAVIALSVLRHRRVRAGLARRRPTRPSAASSSRSRPPTTRRARCSTSATSAATKLDPAAKDGLGYISKVGLERQGDRGARARRRRQRADEQAEGHLDPGRAPVGHRHRRGVDLRPARRRRAASSPCPASASPTTRR